MTPTLLVTNRRFGDKRRRTRRPPDAIHEIATNSGDHVSMDDEGIDDLCERINCG